jgi:predicted DNA-binding protein (MmcQ/YjbR family)
VSDKPDPAVALRDFALAMPGAWEDFPWGESVAKVGKKVFVFMGRPEDGDVGISVKLPHSASEALEEPWAKPTGYGLGKAGWVSCQFESGQEVPVERLQAWIEESWRSVAPKKLIKAYDAGKPGA